MASAPFTSDDFSRDKAKKKKSAHFQFFYPKNLENFRFFENFGSEIGAGSTMTVAV